MDKRSLQGSYSYSSATFSKWVHVCLVLDDMTVQLFVDAQWTQVEVLQKSWLDLLSSIGGAWTLLVAGAAIMLHVVRSAWKVGSSAYVATNDKSFGAHNDHHTH